MARTGRPPADDPLNMTIRARITEALANELAKYCESNGITAAEAMRESLSLLLEAGQERESAEERARKAEKELARIKRALTKFAGELEKLAGRSNKKE